MLYSGLAFLVLSVVMLALGFVGVTPGAGGLANVALLVAFVFLGASAVSLGHHYQTRRRHLRH
jgi:uncharacterized membrane protein YtjA (UPF0391 family)